MIRREDGQVTAFVVAVLLALFVLAALVIDGGYTLAARRRAFNEANAAARAGAQALDVAEFRATGSYLLQPHEAKAAAEGYLAATGHAGNVRVSGDTVAVEVSFTQPMAMLKVLGIDDLSVTGRGEARLVPGTVGGAP